MPATIGAGEYLTLRYTGLALSQGPEAGFRPGRVKDQARVDVWMCVFRARPAKENLLRLLRGMPENGVGPSSVYSFIVTLTLWSNS